MGSHTTWNCIFLESSGPANSLTLSTASTTELSRLSMIETLKPSLRSWSTVWVPMNPAPPVTRIFFSDEPICFQYLPESFQSELRRKKEKSLLVGRDDVEEGKEGKCWGNQGRAIRCEDKEEFKKEETLLDLLIKEGKRGMGLVVFWIFISYFVCLGLKLAGDTACFSEFLFSFSGFLDFIESVCFDIWSFLPQFIRLPYPIFTYLYANPNHSCRQKLPKQKKKSP